MEAAADVLGVGVGKGVPGAGVPGTGFSRKKEFLVPELKVPSLMSEVGYSL